MGIHRVCRCAGKFYRHTLRTHDLSALASLLRHVLGREGGGGSGGSNAGGRGGRDWIRLSVAERVEPIGNAPFFVDGYTAVLASPIRSAVVVMCVSK